MGRITVGGSEGLSAVETSSRRLQHRTAGGAAPGRTHGYRRVLNCGTCGISPRSPTRAPSAAPRSGCSSPSPPSASRSGGWNSSSAPGCCTAAATGCSSRRQAPCCWTPPGTCCRRVDHGVSQTRQAAGLGRPRLRFVMPAALPEALTVKTASAGSGQQPLAPTWTWSGWKRRWTRSSPRSASTAPTPPWAG